jgi:hypothetical protein
MTFKEKVQSMTFKEVVAAMVSGLEAQHVIVDMDTFGYYQLDTCYGCAATNAICEISGSKFVGEEVDVIWSRAKFINCDYPFLYSFEHDIDDIRLPIIEFSLRVVSQPTTQQVKVINSLPPLRNGNWRKDLHKWKQAIERL